jgi:uncharacterized protein (TIGR02147 family)
MENIEDYQQFLNQELVRRTQRNRSFSQRAFAKMLDLSPGELSEILNGKRKLSVKKALLIAEKLTLSPEETLYFLKMTKVTKKLNTIRTSKNLKSQNLSIDTFEIISNWYCFAIINLSECSGFTWDKDYIAKKLDISHAETRDALNRLEKVGLIKRKENGDYDVVSDFIIGPDDISSAAVKKSHYDLLKKAMISLEEKPLDERNITGVGLALTKEEYKDLTKDITQFRRDIVKKYGFSNQNKNKVYQLEIALFELTQGNTDD